MKVEITEALLEQVLPNSIVAVDEEVSLADRVAPYVRDSCRWLESTTVGDVELPESLHEMAVRAVVMRAVIKAIPALDLVVTPSGFGVVSSSNVAPASKERVERLISSLSSSLNDLVIDLQRRCVAVPEWRESTVGRWYCATFLPYVSDVMGLVKNTDPLTVYSDARSLAQDLESRIAEDYIGYPLMSKIKRRFIEGVYDVSTPVVASIRSETLRYVADSLGSAGHECPNPHDPWHAAEAILREIKQDDDLLAEWQEYQSANKSEGFKNTRKGGYFF